MDNPETWKIAAEERTKHNTTFSQLNPLNGTMLSGEQVKPFFLKSGLPTPVLGQIWNLADLNKDGSLDRKEFSIACFLIKKVLTSQQGPAILPVTCPKSLQVDPVSVAPSSTIANTPLIAPSSNPNNKPQASSTPIFSNNFPQANQIPISGISSVPPVASAPNMTMPMITPTPGLPSFPTNFVSPPPNTNIAASVASQPLIAGALFTPLAAVNTNLPNPLVPIPSTSRTKYGQMFQSNDIGSTGFLTGQQAKTILMQSGLAQNILIQIWNLADHDKDGKLSYEEFIVAMHLCDYAKTGSILPSTLPIELQPQRSRSSSAALNTTLSPEPLNKSCSESSPVMANKLMAASFEDKRRENYDRGNAILEAKRQALREQEEREKREREEKERIEAERRQKLKEEQERRRLADMERQMERQRLLDMQREEERRKAIEQRERARNELIKQQRIEWEKQKKQELETQKIKLQEQLSIAKAKDKNLEFDMQALNDKISSYKTKISDNQTSLIDLNNRLDSTRKINSEKHAQMEAAEKEMKDFSQKLARLAQEKYHLNEELKNLKQDSFANEDLVEQNNNLKQKEQSVNQLKQELSKLENQISSARTQLEVVKHELEVTKSDEIELVKENERLSKIIELKKNSLATVTNTAKLNGSLSNSLNKSNNSISSKPVNTPISKASQLDDNSRSATPKNNYDAIKDEIFKIQQTTSSKQEGNFDPFSPGPTVKSSKPESTLKTDSNFNVDWTSAFDQHNETNSGFGVDNDPFTSLNTKQNEKVDPFAAFSSQKTDVSFEDVWSNAPKPQSNLESVFGEIPKSTSINTGFGLDDNWAANLASQTSPTKTTNLNTNTADWAAFPDESSKSSIKNTINFFNDNLKMQSPSIPSHSVAKPNKTNLPSPTANWVKFKALYTFEASQVDELSITEGDVLNVDLNFRADDGWLFGEFRGKSGIFPASFTIKLSDLEAIQEESLAPQPAFPIASNDFAQLAPQINPDKLVTDIKNYFISVYAYISNEPGDLNFREFEVINVISRNEDWLTGQIVGSGIDPSNPLRSGIFPANFVVKFNLPVDYIGKYTISMATEPYVAQNSGELSLDPSSNQLIAIKKISPDAKWSFGETFDINNQIHRGWFPIAAATPLIDAGAPPVYSPAKAESVAQNYSNNSINNELRGANDSSFNQSPPPPQTQKALFPGLQNNDTFKNLEPRKSVNSATTSPMNSGQTESVVALKPAVDETKAEPQTVSASELPNVIIDRVVALYDFAPQTPEAIGFPKDAIINILEKSGDWWLGEYNGKIGILPYNYVQSISQKTVTKRENTSILTNRSVSLQNLSNRQSFPRRSGIQSATYENTDQLEDINAYVNSDFESVLGDNLASSDTISLDSFSQDDMATKNKMRFDIINEIHQTEKNYIKNLKLIVENYKIPLDQKKLLPLIELDTLFLNIEDIISVNVRFYNSLSRRIDEAKQTDQVARISQSFIDYLPKMQIYVDYVSSLNQNVDLINEKIKTSQEIAAIFGNGGISADFFFNKLRLLPLQRLPLYSLLVEKLIKYTPDVEEEFQNLKMAHRLIVDLIKSVNNERGKKEDMEKLEWLDDHINVRGTGFKFKSSTNMMGPRKLCYYGPFVKDSGKELYGFLFNDTLVIAESNDILICEIFKPKLYQKSLQFQLYKPPILLENLNVVQAKQSTTTSDCTFQLIILEKEYTFKTTNPTLRNEWLKQIQKSIEIYKQKKRSLVHSISATNLSQKAAIGRLLVLVMEAQDLMLEPSNDRAIFCEASLGLQKFSTPSINSANPKWNTSMQFQIYDLNKDVVNVMVYDKKIYKPNIFLGKTELKIYQIFREQMKDNQESNPITRMFRMSNVPNGKIMLKMSISIYK